MVSVDDVLGDGPDDAADDDYDYDAPVYVISIAAELAGVHPQTLRSYERRGLVDPSRTQGNTRRYSRRDIDRLRLIQTLTQDEGLNLAGVRVVLDLGERLGDARRRIGELEEMVRHLAARFETRREQTPSGTRYDLVPAPSRDVEVHQHLRRRASRGRRSTR